MDQELFKKGPFKRFDRQQALDYIKQLDNAMRQMREDYERQLADATDELSQANACLETLRVTEATLTQSIQEKASLVEQLTEQLQTAEKQAHEKGLLSEKINSENQLLQEKSNLMQEQIQVLEERIQQAEQRLGTQSNTSQQLQQAVDLLNQANDKITQQQSTIRNLSGQIEQQNQTILDQQAQIEENEQAAKLYLEIRENIDQILLEVRQEADRIRAEANKQAQEILFSARTKAGILSKSNIKTEVKKSNPYEKSNDHILNKILGLKKDLTKGKTL